METAAALHRQTRHYVSTLSSSPASLPPANLHHRSSRLLRRRHHHHHHHNVEKSVMPFGNLILRRLTTTQFLFRFNHPTKVFCIPNHFTLINHDTMTDESKNKDEKADPMMLNISKSNDEKANVPEKSTPAVPPPPEKPFPGDCCGSGCVRCVWDIYYEELEEYNKLYKDDSKTS